MVISIEAFKKVFFSNYKPFWEVYHGSSKLQSFNDMHTDCELEQVPTEKDARKEAVIEKQEDNLHKSWEALEEQLQIYQGDGNRIVKIRLNSCSTSKGEWLAHKVNISQNSPSINGFNSQNKEDFGNYRLPYAELQKKDIEIRRLERELYDARHALEIYKITTANNSASHEVMKVIAPQLGAITQAVLGAFVSKTSIAVAGGDNVKTPPPPFEAQHVENCAEQMKILQEHFAPNLSAIQIAEQLVNLFAEISRQFPEVNPFFFVERLLIVLRENPSYKPMLLGLLK